MMRERSRVMRTHGIILKRRRMLNQPVQQTWSPARALSSLELFLVSWLPLGLRRHGVAAVCVPTPSFPAAGVVAGIHLMFRGDGGGLLSQPPESASRVLMGLEGIDAEMTAVVCSISRITTRLFSPFSSFLFGPISSQQRRLGMGFCKGGMRLGKSGMERQRKQPKQSKRTAEWSPISCRPAVQVGLWPRGGKRRASGVPALPVGPLPTSPQEKKVIARSACRS
ncbi:hypothetical protein F5144DRAFT_620008 [Chaetomium tenue]|uniref:Uncharacterized protein n=1 Tax=Chaetomium tenue TaxID=1854479 RepID=A0ACB7PEZ6_9PEZI|nr:hypothetical protein F5144DRAFT_620008 [Chaetomium globosum]